MAAVTLDRLYLHLASDPSTYIAHPIELTTWSPSVPAERRDLAAGRSRIVARPGRRDSVPLVLSQITTADAITLEEDWPGLELMLRDPRGRLWWGFYADARVEEHASPSEDLHVVSLTFQRTTGTVEV